MELQGAIPHTLSWVLHDVGFECSPTETQSVYFLLELSVVLKRLNTYAVNHHFQFSCRNHLRQKTCNEILQAITGNHLFIAPNQNTLLIRFIDSDLMGQYFCISVDHEAISLHVQSIDWFIFQHAHQAHSSTANCSGFACYINMIEIKMLSLTDCIKGTMGVCHKLSCPIWWS